MRFSFFISTHGGSPLVIGLERGLGQLGHMVDYFRNGRPHDFDFLVIFNQTSHTNSYAFPDFPDYKVPVIFVDSAEYGYFKRLPGIVENYANAFSEGSLNHDTKSRHEEMRLKNYLAGKSFPYFLREFSKYISFPANYYPIDYPLYHHSVCKERPNKRDYFDRPRDFFVSWGASHPWRWGITHALRSVPCNSEIKVIEENGTPRMDQGQYFTKLRTSKCSVSFDGYGSSSFRLTEVLGHTLLLMGPLSIEIRKPLIDGETCIGYDIASEGETFIGTNIAGKLQEALADPERSFRIHEAGYDHLMTHYTEKATAQYLIDTIESHDWSRETVLDIQGDTSCQPSTKQSEMS